MKRTTISDIAQLAQVSRGAVSLALNNKPGVSDATRARVVAIAQSLGWTPHIAARALSSSRAAAIGLVLPRPRAGADAERYYFKLLCGMEAALTGHGHSLVLQMVDDVVEELEVYRSWWAQRRVDGVLLVDPRTSDPRPARLVELGIPFATAGSPLPGGGAIVVDDAEIMERALGHLAASGRTSIAYVGGHSGLQHTLGRQQAFFEQGDRLGLITRLASPTDYSEAAGGAETRRLLSSHRVPDAIVYDNELLTLGGLSVIVENRIDVPARLAVLSLEDSPLCRVVSPQVTSFLHDPAELGAAAVELLLSPDPARVQRLASPVLEVRESTR